jgi:hypothetical protein
MRAYDPDLVADRYREHEECLAKFAQALPPQLPRWEGDYDLLVEVKPNQVLLVEVKTVRGDANHQVRLGLGQLLYYEHFDVKPTFPSAVVESLLVTTVQLGNDLTEFLEGHGVGVLTCCPDGSWKTTQLADAILDRCALELSQ